MPSQLDTLFNSQGDKFKAKENTIICIGYMKWEILAWLILMLEAVSRGVVH